VEVAVRAGDLLKEIVPDIEKTAELIREITAANNEQSAGAEQINEALQQLDHVVEQNAAASEEMASTSADLAGQAHGLEQLVAFFKVQGGPAPAARPVARVYRPTPKALAATPARRGMPLNMDETDDNGFERF
jgi:methyl-accepting chemotaxis protein